MKNVLVILMILVIGFASSASAVMEGPLWPAPGGTFYSTSGNAGTTGGMTISYSGFDSTQYSELFWGAWEGAPIGASLNGLDITTAELMTFSGIAGNTATWTGSTSWSWYSGNYLNYNSPIATRLTVKVTPMNFVPAADYGVPSIGALAPVTGPFSANLLFEANYFGNWLPLITGYNSYQTLSGVQTAFTFSGGFYNSTAPVPAPAAIWLLGTGLVSIVCVKRRQYIS
jgi:hypothetical protein